MLIPLLPFEKRAQLWFAVGASVRVRGKPVPGRVARSVERLVAQPIRALGQLRNLAGRTHYPLLSEQELFESRTSDTVYIFGSGASINDITRPEWETIAMANTISLREFPRQSFVRADYHITGEVTDVHEYARRLRHNPLYAKTIFIVQEGWHAYNGNNLIGLRLLPEGARVFRYRRTSRWRYAPYSHTFRDGIVHGFNSIIGATNFAYLMGWRRIVLVGVDLYDKRYFWLPPDVTRHDEKPGIRYDSLFTGYNFIVDMLGRWGSDMAHEDVELTVFNPRSLLAKVLPVVDRAPQW